MREHDNCSLRTEGSGENCPPGHDCAECEHYEMPDAETLNDWDYHRRVDRELEEAAESGDHETMEEEPPGSEDAGITPPHNARRNA